MKSVRFSKEATQTLIRKVYIYNCRLKLYSRNTFWDHRSVSGCHCTSHKWNSADVKGHLFGNLWADANAHLIIIDEMMITTEPLNVKYLLLAIYNLHTKRKCLINTGKI